MAAAKKQTKKDLENKIAELEAKLNQLAAKIETKPAEVKPAKAKPAEVKPAERPAATTKPKGTLPKGAEQKPAETKPAEAPKPTETTAQLPATVQDALENAYRTAPMSDFHQYRAKVTGYSPAPNRYFVRLHAPVGKVPTSNWNEQKAKVTGYTQPSNQYFATRQRLAYHPTDKRFESFSGVNLSVEGVAAQTQQAPPPEVTKPKGTLPKGSTQQSSTSDNAGKSKKQSLEEYEADYMNRMADEQKENEELMRAAAELRAKRQAESPASDSPSKKGALPKGF